MGIVCVGIGSWHELDYGIIADLQGCSKRQKVFVVLRIPVCTVIDTGLINHVYIKYIGIRYAEFRMLFHEQNPSACR